MKLTNVYMTMIMAGHGLTAWLWVITFLAMLDISDKSQQPAFMMLLVLLTLLIGVFLYLSMVLLETNEKDI